MLPNNFDATGGRDKWGTPNASIPQYLENNRKMYTMENVPAKWSAPKKPTNLNAAKRNYDALSMTPAEIDERDYNKRDQENYRIEQQYGSDQGKARLLSQIREEGGSSFTPDQAKMSGVYTPHNAPGSYSGEGSQSSAPQWQQNLTKLYPELGIEGSAANDKFKSEFTSSMSKAEVDELAQRSMGDFSSSPQPDTSKLKPLIGAAERWGTALNDRPGGGRNFENLSRPMGQGALDQRPNRQDSAQQTKDYYARKDARDARNARNRGYVESGKRGTTRFSAYDPPETTD